MPDPAARYRVSMPRPATHLLHVEMEIAEPGGAVELRLPVWTPGSYMVREFSRHVQSFEARSATDGSLEWRKDRKDTWHVDSRNEPSITVAYDVYANDLTVRTSHLDATHAFFNAANLLPYVEGRAQRRHLLEILAPSRWTIATGLRPLEKRKNAFVAEDYDELVDSPVHISPDPVHAFK